MDSMCDQTLGPRASHKAAVTVILVAGCRVAKQNLLAACLVTWQRIGHHKHRARLFAKKGRNFGRTRNGHDTFEFFEFLSRFSARSLGFQLNV